MARRKKKGRSKGSGTPAPIVFEDLEGNAAAPDDDDEIGEPFDDAPEDEDADPRANDPFAERDDEESEGEPEDEEDELEASPEDEEEPDDEAEGDVKDPKLQALIESQRRQIEELERERGLSRKQLEELNKTLNEGRVKEIETKLANARAELKAAIEDGDTDKQVELQVHLADLHATKREVSSTQAAQTAKVEKSEEPAAPRVTAQTPAAERWLRGKSWVNDPAYEAQTRELLRIANVLVEDGYDPNADEYYEELERRLRRKHPELVPEKKAKPKPRQRVSPVSRDDPPSARGATKVVLTSDDRANMITFGLDPNDENVRREYAKNKIREEANARR